MPKTDTPATPTGTELITLDAVQDALLNNADVGVVDEEAIQADMVRRILASNTLEEAFSGFHATSAADVEGVPLQVRGIAWLKSAFEEGPKVYGLLDVVRKDTGELLTVSMGGRSLLASFIWAQRNMAMPFEGAFFMERSRANPERAFWTFKLA